MNPKNTSWGGNAKWYDKLIADEDSYQQKVILPNLVRLMEIKPKEKILDIGCGTGFFSRTFSNLKAEVVGVDLGAELIAIAKKQSPNIKFEIGSADQLNFLKTETFDKAVMVLSLQNIENAAGALKEANRVLKKSGKLFLVLNHPAFRIPGGSSWGWQDGPDKNSGVQYRRLDSYLSEKKAKIQMHPGNKPEDVTWSFHRPLQFYFKALAKNGLVVERLEEWISHRTTGAGPRKIAEDRARSEFPLFLALVVLKR